MAVRERMALYVRDLLMGEEINGAVRKDWTRRSKA